MLGSVTRGRDSESRRSFVVVAVAVLLLPVKIQLELTAEPKRQAEQCGSCPCREGGRRVSVLVCPRPTCPFELKVAVLCVLTVAV